jgi:hypothetical protein
MPHVIFACMIIGWRLLRENTAGLYSATDGNYTKRNYEYAFEWGQLVRLAETMMGKRHDELLERQYER